MGLWKKGVAGSDMQRLVPTKAGHTIQSKGSQDEDISIRSDGSFDQSSKPKPKGIFKRYKLPKFRKLVEMEEEREGETILYEPPHAFLVANSSNEDIENTDLNMNIALDNKNNQKSKVRILPKLMKPLPHTSERPSTFSPLENIATASSSEYEPPSFSLESILPTMGDASSKSSSKSLGDVLGSDNPPRKMTLEDEEQTVPTACSIADAKEFRQFVFSDNFGTIDGVAVQKSEAGSNFNDFLTDKVIGLTTKLRQQHSVACLQPGEDHHNSNTLSAKKRFKERHALSKPNEDSKVRHNITNHRDVPPPESAHQLKRHGLRIPNGERIARQPIRKKGIPTSTSSLSSGRANDSLPRTINTVMPPPTDVSVMSNTSAYHSVMGSTHTSFISDSPFYDSDEEMGDAENDPFREKVDDTDWGSPPPKLGQVLSNAGEHGNDPFCTATETTNPFASLDSQSQDPFLTLHNRETPAPIIAGKPAVKDPFETIPVLNNDPSVKQATKANQDGFNFQSTGNPFKSNEVTLNESAKQDTRNNALVSTVQTKDVVDSKTTRTLPQAVLDTKEKQITTPIKTPSKKSKKNDTIIESIRNSAARGRGKDADESSRKPDPPSPQTARKLKLARHEQQQAAKLQQGMNRAENRSKIDLLCSDTMMETKEAQRGNPQNANNTPQKLPPTGVPVNAIFASMLFRQSNPDGEIKLKSHDDCDDDDDEEFQGDVPPSIMTDGTESTVSSVTEEASTFYQKNFAWNKQANNALARYHQTKGGGDYMSEGTNHKPAENDTHNYMSGSNYKLTQKQGGAHHGRLMGHHRKNQMMRDTHVRSDNIHLLESVEEEHLNMFSP
jgi:hypothetical protein